MINLQSLEVWFVTGSQHLYGEETLRQVAEHAQVIARALNDSPQLPVKVVCQPTVKDAGGDLSRSVRRPIWRRGLHRHHRLDAHLLPRQNVDRRTKGPAKTPAPSSYPVQPRYPLERYRHGLYEPQPERPRRPGIRIHHEQDAPRTARSLRDTGSDLDVLERLNAWARAAVAGMA